MNENTEILTPNPEAEVKEIVTEADFPEKSSRLQDLISEYKKDNPAQSASIPAPRTTTQVATLSLGTELGERTLEELSDDEKVRVTEYVSIDYLDSRALQSYGSAKESMITKNSNEIISKYSTGDAGELTSPLTELVATMKTNNPKEVVAKLTLPSGKKLSLSEIFQMKNAKKALTKMLAEHDSIYNNLKAVEVKFRERQLSLLDDVEAFNNMREGTFQQVEDFELFSIGLTLMIEDAEIKLNRLANTPNPSLRDRKTMEDLQHAIDRMYSRKATIVSVQTTTFQMMPQLMALIRGDEIVCDKIDEVIYLLIPMWSWQYAIAVGILRQQEILNFLDGVSALTANLTKNTATMVFDNAAKAYSKLYEAADALDNMMYIQGYIDKYFESYNSTSESSRRETVSCMKSMREIQAKNVNHLTGGTT